MSENNSVQRESWSGRWGFILAAAGSAIGLGNIWRFPYITGENGGGAFILVYLLCVAVVGLPVMICEVALGRSSQRNPVGCFARLSPSASVLAHFLGGGLVFSGVALMCFRTWGWGIVSLLLGALVFWRSWRVVGIVGVLAGFLILSYYSVIGGWAIGYMLESLRSRLTFAEVAEAKQFFIGFSGNPFIALSYHLVFMACCVAIIYAGVQKGIERACQVMIPLLWLIMLVLILRGVTLPGAEPGVKFCFSPDFSKLTGRSVLIALSHAFFTLSLGMGAMITYGSYLKKEENIFTASLWITGMDTAVSILACLMIFPAVFAFGFEPSEGPGLVFQVLPTILNRLPGGAFWGVMFFLLLSMAALTSGISLLEVVTAYFVDERAWPRKLAAVVVGLAIFLFGCLTIVSLNDWSSVIWLRNILVAAFGAARSSFFDMVDNLTCNWMLPLGGLFISIFVGWVWGVRKALEEIRHGSQNFGDVHLLSLVAGLKDDPAHNSAIHALTLASLWGVFVRFVCPLAILVTFLHIIGVIDLGR